MPPHIPGLGSTAFPAVYTCQNLENRGSGDGQKILCGNIRGIGMIEDHKDLLSPLPFQKGKFLHCRNDTFHLVAPAETGYETLKKFKLPVVRSRNKDHMTGNGKLNFTGIENRDVIFFPCLQDLCILLLCPEKLGDAAMS